LAHSNLSNGKMDINIRPRYLKKGVSFLVWYSYLILNFYYSFWIAKLLSSLILNIWIILKQKRNAENNFFFLAKQEVQCYFSEINVKFETCETSLDDYDNNSKLIKSDLQSNICTGKTVPNRKNMFKINYLRKMDIPIAIFNNIRFYFI